MTKNKVLLLASCGIGVSFLVDYLYKKNLYISGNVYNFILPLLIEISLTVFLFSLITYKMREEVFRSWVHFVYWWIPLSIFLTFITPEDQGGGFGPQMSLGKEDTAFVFSALFIVVSIILIIYKSINLRGK